MPLPFATGKTAREHNISVQIAAAVNSVCERVIFTVISFAVPNPVRAVVSQISRFVAASVVAIFAFARLWRDG